MKKICQNPECKKELGKRRRKYCSRRCQSRTIYIYRSERIKESNDKWNKANPKKRKEISRKSFLRFYNKNRKRFNKLMNDGYYRNKDKWKCRSYTQKIIEGKGGFPKMVNAPEKICSKCSSLEKVQIHHEIYPQTRKEIEQAIIDGKIYYLCFKCHRWHHKICNSKVVHADRNI